MSKTTREDSIHPEVKAFFDPNAHTASYLVIDPDGARCAVTEAEFVALRSARDRRLRPPAKMQSALRFNLRADGEGLQ